MEAPNAPAPYVCKHECERNKLKDIIFQQGKNAATAAKEYSANMEAARQALAARDAEIEGLGEALHGLSAMLLLTGALDDEKTHAAYEKVVARFAALSERQP